MLLSHIARLSNLTQPAPRSLLLPAQPPLNTRILSKSNFTLILAPHTEINSTIFDLLSSFLSHLLFAPHRDLRGHSHELSIHLVLTSVGFLDKETLSQLKASHTDPHFFIMVSWVQEVQNSKKNQKQ